MDRKIIIVLGVKIDVISLRHLIRKIDTLVRRRERAKVMYANIHTVNLAYKDESFLEVFNNAHLLYCDGDGVKWGARLLGSSLPTRMTGADWIWDLGRMCERSGHSIYILAGEKGIAARAAYILCQNFPGLKIAGTHHGYFSKSGEENDEIIATINRSAPDILLVGFDSPHQEKWIHKNFTRLNATVVWSVGALVDYVSGKVPRGPRWMLDHSLEWLFRLLIEPGRMWRRYIIGIGAFFLRILKWKLTK